MFCSINVLIQQKGLFLKHIFSNYVISISISISIIIIIIII